MSSKAYEIVYERGGFRLGWDRTSTGTLRSPNLQISWYDAEARRLRFQSAGTADLQVGRAALDRKYTEATGGACAFCVACGQSIASARDYLVLDALCDYYDEKGEKAISSDSIRARLKHVRDFLEGTRRQAITCANITDLTVEAFRDWSQKQPVEARNKRGEVTRTRTRSLATTEESLIQLKAALNWAKRMRRIEAVPHIALRGRRNVSAPNTTRLGISVLADMLRYAAACPRRSALHKFILGSICTLGRPDAVLDISTNPAREQWKPGDHLLRLNPKGRLQTRKFRAEVAVPRQLGEWLAATHADPSANHWFVDYRGERVRDTDSAWNTMLEALGLPVTREHKSYVIRRSMATILRSWHHDAGGTAVDPWELQAQLGHRMRSSTEVYALAAPNARDTVQVALQQVLDELERLAPEAFHRKCTGEAVASPMLKIVAGSDFPQKAAA